MGKFIQIIPDFLGEIMLCSSTCHPSAFATEIRKYANFDFYSIYNPIKNKGTFNI